jgi:hypothetical protein
MERIKALYADSPIARTVTRSLAVISAVMIPTLGIGAAGATTTDLTNGAGDTFFSTITSYFTGDVLPAVLVLLALMVGVGVLIKWGKRAAKSS